MRKYLISLMAYCVLLGTFAVCQEDGAAPAPAEDVAAPAAATEPDKPAEQPPVVAVEPAKADESAVAAETPKATEAEKPAQAASVLDDLLKASEPPKAVEPPPEAAPAVAVEAPKAAEPEKPAQTASALDDLLKASEPPKAVEPPAVVQPEPVAPPPAKIDVEGVAVEPPPKANVEGVPPVVEPEKPVVKKAPEVLELENLQQVTRQALQTHALAQIAKGEAAFMDGKFQDAVNLLQEAQTALQTVGDREGNEALNQRIDKLLGDTYYNWARLLMNERNFVESRQMARNAGKYWHPKTAELLGEIEKAENKPPESKRIYPPVRWEQKDYIVQQRDLAARMKMAKQYYLTGEYNRARELYESIMRIDPENTEAIRMMHKIGEIKERASMQEREMTRQGMIAETRKAWNRRDYVDLGELGEMRTNVVGGVRAPPDEILRQEILKKMEKIMMPEIDFRQANIRDVVDFLSKESREQDKEETDQTKKGVNIVLNLAAPGMQRQEAAQPAIVDPFAPPAPAAGPVGAENNINLITFSAHNISLHEALKIVCNVANLKYRVEGSIVMVLPLDAPEGRIIHRMYDVLPSFIQRVAEVGQGLFLAGPGMAPGGLGGGAPAPGGGAGDARGDLKATFSSFGIAWPQGSSIQHLPQIGKLIVANTADNLATFEKILSVLNVVPHQIEIEARFVEVRQTDIESLGIEWLLTDDWEVMQRRGSEGLPLDQRQRIQIGAGNISTGTRFLNSGAMLPPGVGSINDNVLRVSSVLTNPELSMILHAIQQKGNADLLSAPKVTTKSAAEATIKVVREYIYPTEFTVTPIMGAAAGGINTVVGGVVEPGGFETREVGVILSVMPEVTPDGQMIDLTMTPQVVDEPDWENYGSQYTGPDGQTQTLPMRQPIFKARSVSTSLSIYNGSTVVLGGMINEIRNTVDDKIPILGDLPLIGRLFRSQYDHSDKRNLLIFVTARLVDPGGRAITPQEKMMPLLIPNLASGGR